MGLVEEKLKMFSLILKYFNYYVKKLQSNSYQLKNNEITTVRILDEYI